MAEAVVGSMCEAGEEVQDPLKIMKMEPITPGKIFAAARDMTKETNRLTRKTDVSVASCVYFPGKRTKTSFAKFASSCRY